MTSSKSSQYSSESTTTEIFEIPQFARRTLSISVVIQIVSAAILIFVCVYQMTICSRIKFAGVTFLFGILLFVFSLAIGYTTYSQQRKCSLVMSILALVTTVVLVTHEIICWVCIEEEVSGEFCSNFNETFNTCKWLGPSKPKKQSHSPRISSTAAVENEKFTEGRIALMGLSTVCCICFAISVLLIFITVKMGKPVYLNRKRHKGSIVVGDKINVGLSNKNKLRNIGTTRATDEEFKQYNMTRKKAFTEHKSEVFTSTGVVKSRTKTESSKVSNTDERHRSKSKVTSRSITSPIGSHSPSPDGSSVDRKEEESKPRSR